MSQFVCSDLTVEYHKRDMARAVFGVALPPRAVAAADQIGKPGRACLEWLAPDHVAADMRSATAAAHVRASAERAARSGLVSVPTRGIPGLSSEVSASNAAAASKALQATVGAFEVDHAARRYSGLRMAVGFAARAHAVSRNGFRDDVPWMVTTTYAGDNTAWKPAHVKEAIRACRNWFKRKGIACRYVWVAELQKRGVIHYHLVFWLPVGVRMPQWDRAGWWPHGMTNTEEARHATAYLMAYLKKGDLEERGALPKGARNYGVGGLDHSLRRARRWLRLPAFVQGNSSLYDNWTRTPGGGWTSPDGELFCSEYRAVFVGGVRCLHRVARHPTVIDAQGPFSWLSDRERASALTH